MNPTATRCANPNCRHVLIAHNSAGCVVLHCKCKAFEKVEAKEKA